MLSNPNVRKWVYVGQVVLGAVLVVLVAFGIIDQATSDSITDSLDKIIVGLSGLTFMGVGALARRNLSPRPATIGADGVALITDALDAHAKATAPQAVAAVRRADTPSVEQARRDIEQRLGAPNREG